MPNQNENNTTTYTFDLPRMQDAVCGIDSNEVVVLSGNLTPEQVQSEMERVYFELVAQEG